MGVSPSFISQYGPLIAALIALLGVLLTLYVSSRRARKDSLVQREDDYRRSVRESVAQVLSEARKFQRLSMAMSDPSYFISLGYKSATALRDETDDAMLSLSQALINARLLALDAPLQESLDRLMHDLDDMAGVVHEAVDAFWEGRLPDGAWLERDKRSVALSESCALLQGSANVLLAPTVRASRAKLLGRRSNHYRDV